MCVLRFNEILIHNQQQPNKSLLLETKYVDSIQTSRFANIWS